MSVTVMAEVWRLDLPLAEKAVLLALADHAHDDGTKSYPGNARLIYKTGLSETTLHRVLRVLKDTGLIVATAHEKGGRGRATEYRVVTSAGVRLPDFADWKAARGKGADSTTDSEGERVPSEAERVPDEALKGIGDGTPTTSLQPSSPTITCASVLRTGAPCPGGSPCWYHNGPWEAAFLEGGKYRPETGRLRDSVWEGLVIVAGYAPANGLERGRFSKAAAMIREAGGVGPEIVRRARAYDQRMPGVPLTPMALAANWSSLGAPDSRRGTVGGTIEAVARAAKAAESRQRR